MQSRIADFEAQGVLIFGISTDSVEESRALAAGLGLDFQLLSDPELKAIDAYGLRHAEGNPMASSDIARPGSFLVSESGSIQWRELTENWRVRLRPEHVLSALSAP